MECVLEPTIYGQLIRSLAKHIEHEYPLSYTFSQWSDSHLSSVIDTLTFWYKGTPYAALEFCPDYITVHSGPRYTDNWLRTAQVDYADPTMLDQIHAILSAIEL